MSESKDERKKICYEVNGGISIFGLHIPYWLIILLLVLFIIYMWIEDKSPLEVFSLEDNDFHFSTFDSPYRRSFNTPMIPPNGQFM